MNQRVRAYGDRWPWLGVALDVQERVGEINGGFAASAITVSVFVAIFPLLLVGLAVVGFVAAGDTTLAPRLIDNLGLSGAAADAMTGALERAANSRQAASIIGLVGLVWAGSGVAVALQQGVRLPWQERSNGIKDRVFAMAWLVVAALGFAASMALGGVLNFLPSWAPAIVATLLSILLGLAVEIALFTWMFWGLGTRRVPWRALVPGALIAAAGFEVLKLVGTVLVPNMVAHSSALYGSIGVVFAVLAWLALFAKLLVYSSTFNAVRYEAAHGSIEVPILGPNLPGLSPTRASRGGVLVE